MKKSFFSHFVTIGIGTVINIFLGLIATPIITRIVSPDDYGHLSVFTMYTGLAVMILCCGLDQALVRFYYESNELSYKRALLSKCVTIPLGATFIFGLIVIFLSFNGILSDEFSQTIYILFSVYVAIEILNRFAANSHFLRTAGPHFPDSQGHIKRTALEIGRAERVPPC